MSYPGSIPATAAGIGVIYYDSAAKKFKASVDGGSYGNILTSGTSIYFSNGGNAFGAPAILGTNDTNTLTLGTNAIARLTVDTSGNVGIGTATPNNMLHLYKTSANPEIDLQGVAGTNAHWAIYNERTSPANSLRFWVNSTGTVGDAANNVLTLGHDGIISMAKLQVTNGASTGAVLSAADASGTAQWAAANCSGGKFVGVTNASTEIYTGNAGGYVGMNAKCSAASGAAFAGSHICTPDEILRSAKCFGTTGWGSLSPAWIANGGPGFTAPRSDDCNGWKSNGATRYGDYWAFDVDGGNSQACTCNLSLPVACCK